MLLPPPRRMEKAWNGWKKMERHRRRLSVCRLCQRLLASKDVTLINIHELIMNINEAAGDARLQEMI